MLIIPRIGFWSDAARRELLAQQPWPARPSTPQPNVVERFGSALRIWITTDEALSLLQHYGTRFTPAKATVAVSKHFFPVTEASLADWPISVSRSEGGPFLLTVEVFEEAKRRALAGTG